LHFLNKRFFQYADEEKKRLIKIMPIYATFKKKNYVHVALINKHTKPLTKRNYREEKKTLENKREKKYGWPTNKNATLIIFKTQKNPTQPPKKIIITRHYLFLALFSLYMPIKKTFIKKKNFVTFFDPFIFRKYTRRHEYGGPIEHLWA